MMWSAGAGKNPTQGWGCPLPPTDDRRKLVPGNVTATRMSEPGNQEA
jgi:hypothetical protein